MSRRALILAAHGSFADPTVNLRLCKFAELLRRRVTFDAVAVAFQQGTPTFACVLDTVDADEYVVVPVMTSEGHYGEEVLPHELRKNRRFSAERVRQTRPIGTHPGMIDLVARRVYALAHHITSTSTSDRQGKVEKSNPGRFASRAGSRKVETESNHDREKIVDTAMVGKKPIHSAGAHSLRQAPRWGEWPILSEPFTLVLVGHGAETNPSSRNATVLLVHALRQRGICAEVLPAFLDDDPRVETIASSAKHDVIIVIPFLIAGGPHATRDIPRRLGLSIAPGANPPFDGRIGRHRIICDAAVGTDPGIVDLIANSAENIRPTARPATDSNTKRPASSVSRRPSQCPGG
jgi:sirohydrochlorin ferrochelatase